MKVLWRLLIIAALVACLLYGYQQYRLRTAVPPLVDVDTGERIQCYGCGKILYENVQTIRVRADQAHKYGIEKKSGVCEECRRKGVG
ncbi:MAG TPA: hypothetical protein ENN74_00345 [Firmicutes bacterium]|nr:hypothetical protein [Bacillota bacterium]